MNKPPLLNEMAQLAVVGHCELEATPDFPRMEVEMRKLEWTDEHRCFIGGPEFKTMRVPASWRHAMYIPRPMEINVNIFAVTNSERFNYDLEPQVDLYQENTYVLTVIASSKVGGPYERQPRFVARYMCHSTYTLPEPHAQAMERVR